MATPGKPAPNAGPSSRWGSFLSQAVAGVESRLDNMLSEEDSKKLQQQQQQAGKQPQAQAPMSIPASKNAGSAGASRSSSRTRPSANDRLQARLAKAVAAKQVGGGDSKASASPRSSIDTSRSSMDRVSMDRAEKKPSEEEQKPPAAPSEPELAIPLESSTAPAATTTTADPAQAKPVAQPFPNPEPETDGAKPSPGVQEEETKKDQPEAQISPKETPEPVPVAQADSSKEVDALTKELEEAKVRYQEEIQEYSERVDSLQSKLQYLSKSAAESAKKSASSAASGSADRKLAEKDEKIALLMEEGQKLSGMEQKLRTTIRKLRQQMTDNEKQKAELEKSRDKARSEAESWQSRLNNSEESEKLQEANKKATATLQKEIDLLKIHKTSQEETISRLEKELATTEERVEAICAEAHAKVLAAEKEKQKELEGIITSLKAEKEELATQGRLEQEEWKEKVARAQERTRVVEEELKLEILALENKLEAMRSVAEEASSGSGGEGQIKLIRQIETLQSQYATASGNWQGIEASLLAKVANLEKERDDAQRRESEMRKKARDAASRARNMEDELQDVQPALATAKQELETCREEMASLQASLKASEAALDQTRADLEKQQRAAVRDFPGEVGARPWAEEPIVLPFARNQSRPDSPLNSLSRTFSSDLGALQRARRTPEIPQEGLGLGLGLGGLGRRMSSQPPPPPRTNTLSSAGVGNSASSFVAFDEPSNGHAPSVVEREEAVDDKVSSSPRQIAHDMISVSTVGAGPSVQLVERMSAAIRRLEAEKVAAKEEMARICSQRDGARADIVGLMKDIESAKQAKTKVAEMEKEMDELNARYQTTLELLGEKSELVEELKADVQDVKAMYRELVERTVK
ncbi:unnamed protein product [Clonostachys chloroleuca]|uniref:TATA element modulatory factor 1 TATA binding domain-containing protein n=1 Tax=Clonostachys chloroleuca TaxID=1926264 RepID=A0AA35VSQ4_9HYPO|nr:unnamed protein product [Clonostachys chloroleuca]